MGHNAVGLLNHFITPVYKNHYKNILQAAALHLIDCKSQYKNILQAAAQHLIDCIIPNPKNIA